MWKSWAQTNEGWAIWESKNQNQETDGGRWEGTTKFRIHSVTAEFSGETLNSPWAGANKINHNPGVRAAASNRSPHITSHTHTGLALFTVGSQRKCWPNICRHLVIAEDHKDRYKIQKKRSVDFERWGNSWRSSFFLHFKKHVQLKGGSC